MGLGPKYYLLAGDTSQFFFPYLGQKWINNMNYLSSKRSLAYREYPASIQKKIASSALSWVSRYILFLGKPKGRGRPFWEGAIREAKLWDLPQEHLVVIREENVSPFVKFEIILSLLCLLLDPLTNKPCRAWSSMINLWIDSRIWKESCCQQGRDLAIT